MTPRDVYLENVLRGQDGKLIDCRRGRRDKQKKFFSFRSTHWASVGQGLQRQVGYLRARLQRDARQLVAVLAKWHGGGVGNLLALGQV